MYVLDSEFFKLQFMTIRIVCACARVCVRACVY